MTERWEHALSELEAHVSDLEAIVAARSGGPATPWHPPTDLGPLPATLLPRARRLARRQEDLLRAIPGVMASIANHRRAVDRMGEALVAPRLPVYLDIAT